MKYQANPITVDAFKILNVYPIHDDSGALKHYELLLDKDDKTVIADSGMTARYTPVPGDYLIIQDDGYQYLNPKAVFERKYAPA